MTNNPTLKVLEAYTRDVGRGVARIDYESMDSLSASTGDVIEIKGGKRRTVAKCYLSILQTREKVLSELMAFHGITVVWPLEILSK